MRIAFVTDAELVNSNYRCYQPMHALERGGHEIEHNRVGAPRFRISSLRRADVVHIHRYADAEMVDVTRQLRSLGVGTLWDNDDDITAIPRESPHYRSIGGPANRAKVMRAVKSMVNAVDVVTTPSSRLAEQFRDAGAADVRVLENFLPPEFGNASPRKHTGITIAWLAGLEHQLDYQRLRLKPVFEELLDRHADLRVLSVGLGLGLPPDRYEHRPLVDFLQLAEVLSHADIGIAPLADIPWNQARSNVKVKEYAAAGLPWLASPVTPYCGLGEKQGGMLVSDDTWSTALEDLICNSRARKKLSKNAKKWAKSQLIDQHAHLWLQAYKDAAMRARSSAAGPSS